MRIRIACNEDAGCRGKVVQEDKLWRIMLNVLNAELPDLIIFSTTAVIPSSESCLSIERLLNRGKSEGFIWFKLLSLQWLMIMLLHCFSCFSRVAFTGWSVNIGLKFLKSLPDVFSVEAASIVVVSSETPSRERIRDGFASNPLTEGLDSDNC